MSIIAIDYDDTFSSPLKDVITHFMIELKKNNHRVVLVTARNEEKEKIDDDLSLFDDVVYTNGKAKAGFIRADLWLEDSPITLCCDFVPGEPHATPSKALHQGYKNKHILWNWEENKFVSYIKKSFRKD